MAALRVIKEKLALINAGLVRHQASSLHSRHIIRIFEIVIAFILSGETTRDEEGGKLRFLNGRMFGRSDFSTIANCTSLQNIHVEGTDLDWAYDAAF